MNRIERSISSKHWTLFEYDEVAGRIYTLIYNFASALNEAHVESAFFFVWFSSKQMLTLTSINDITIAPNAFGHSQTRCIVTSG